MQMKWERQRERAESETTEKMDANPWSCGLPLIYIPSPVFTLLNVDGVRPTVFIALYLRSIST